MRIFLRSTLLILLLTALVSTSLSQRSQTFTSPDGDWELTLPRGYEIEVNRDGIAEIIGDDVEMELYSHAVLDELDYGDIDDPGELVEIYADDEGYDMEEPEDGNEDPTFFLALLTSRRDSVIAVSKVFSDDTLGLVLVVVGGDAPDDVFTDITDIINSWDVIGNTGGGDKDPDTTGDFPDELSDFDGDWEDAVAELEDAGIIPEDGELVFFEDEAFVQSTGFTYTALASRANEQNVVIAGELTFEPDGDEFQTCSLAARVITNSRGGTNIFMEVGFDNENNVYVYDVFDEGEDDTIFENPGSAGRGDTHHFLAIIIDESITIYVDGELLAENIEITEREGSFGIMLRGDSSDARCEGNNIWAYTID